VRNGDYYGPEPRKVKPANIDDNVIMLN
jgi:hypothetical protein